MFQLCDIVETLTSIETRCILNTLRSLIHSYFDLSPPQSRPESIRHWASKQRPLVDIAYINRLEFPFDKNHSWSEVRLQI